MSTEQEIQGAVDAATAMAYRVGVTLANRRGWNYDVERHLQAGVEDTLVEGGFRVAAEVRLDAHNRIDFMVSDPTTRDIPAMGIECKTRGSVADLRRQVMRYLAIPGVPQILVVSSDPKHATLPPTMLGKPVRTFIVGGW